MNLTRRAFLQLSGAAAGGILLGHGPDRTGRPVEALSTDLKIKYGKDSTTICPYCSVGCGVIMTQREGKVINTEGDPDHPINRGALCSKGSSLYQVANNERRLTGVKYRRPGSNVWHDVSWDFALERIAERIKETRDQTWTEKDEQGQTLNHTQGIAILGSAIVNNEECYLIHKLARALGVVNLEHQARLCHSSTVAGLAASFGRGAMTNHWIDLKNSDCLLMIGSNPAENHPISFKWVQEAQKQGAKVISADPRYTRSSSSADIYVPFRPGTDIAFIGGMINYILENELFNRDYIKAFTNAPFLIDPNFSFKDGLFGGYEEESRSYSRDTWGYQHDEDGNLRRDTELSDPNTVLKHLREHYSRYDIDTVCEITGTPRERYLEVVKLYAETAPDTKAGTIMYAMGTTQHTKGSQNVRSYAILQLLLGNIGIPGGGVNALRGISNVQGSTDQALLYHLLPGYLGVPTAGDNTLADYLERITPEALAPESVNYWKNTPKFVISQLKAFFGDHAAGENDFCFDYLPRIRGDHSFMSIFKEISRGTIQGMLCIGMNPAVSGPNAELLRESMENLDWLVVADLWKTETADFWRRPHANPARINTEVFLLPAAASMEKEGSITNSGRWSQWRYRAVEPPGAARSDLWIIDSIFKHVRKKYENSRDKKDRPILHMQWNYESEDRDPDPHLVAKEVNGYHLDEGRLLDGFNELEDNGTTSSGNWLYCGSYTEEGNQAARRNTENPGELGLHPEWAFSWPANRRILYNRASCDREGNPRDPQRRLLFWDGKRWQGDVPDFPATSPPEEELGAFIMLPEGYGRLFGIDSLSDGPFPEHYEPLESPLFNLLSTQAKNPAMRIWETPDLNPTGDPDKFPIIATTYRVSEHWQAGAMTRNQPWLVELMPDMFVEMSESLAQKKGIHHGDLVSVETARGTIRAHAFVTGRIKPFVLNGQEYEQVALPWHYGYSGLSTGDSANCLTPFAGDANTQIPEYKAFLCKIYKGGERQ